ncbi:MAG: 50S ribosomal protein P1 [Candidatus Micrarchaeota archaeon]|nr:50S ribosomal protein P1 [Candidatus Micrarchaeota archaeon]
MKVDPYLHAALLLYGTGKEITKDALVAVIKASGAEADEAKAQVLADALKGVNIADALSSAAVQFASASQAPQATQQASEQKKEEKKEEKKAEEANTAEGLAALFG